MYQTLNDSFQEVTLAGSKGQGDTSFKHCPPGTSLKGSY